MESIGQLTGGVAHDFNNLLTIIIGNLERMLRQLDRPGHDAERLKQFAGNALRGAQRAAALTRQLLAFSRRQPLDPRAIDVNALVAGMSDLLRRSLGERIEIKTVLGEELWQAYADPNQLEGALLNLAVNARDAMPEGGTLTIETANRGEDGAPPEAEPGPHVVIRMRDTGIGHERRDRRARLRAVLHDQGCRSRNGSRAFTSVWVCQAVGRACQDRQCAGPRYGGDAFPAARSGGGAQQKDQPVNPAQPASSAGEMVLVVEDDPDVRAHSIEILRELGYATFEAPDAKEALAVIRREPAIVLLFSDLGLPGGMNGRQLAEEALRLARLRSSLRPVTHAARLPKARSCPPALRSFAKPFEFAALGAEAPWRAACRPRSRFSSWRMKRLRVRSLAQDLEALGFDVEEAASAAQALENATGICAAIIDFGLPGMKGDELAAELRKRNAVLPLIIASGYGEAQIRERLSPDAFTRFMGKPYNSGQLEAALRDLGLGSSVRQA